MEIKNTYHDIWKLEQAFVLVSLKHMGIFLENQIIGNKIMTGI